MAQKPGETITREQYLSLLGLAPTGFLEQLGNKMLYILHTIPEDSQEAKDTGIMLLMLAREVELRQIEPLWRKARRFAIRNSDTFKEIGKIAACIGAGAILGISLDDS